MTTQPTPEEIREFLDIWTGLCQFEGHHRMIRHWGLFDESDTLPNPACVKVQEWLAGMCGYKFDTQPPSDIG
jgi:hypothetical protein